ncbi:AAA family ATPase [Microcoleus sp. FACHB-68]|uniref:AAA family ATPase n=1 Tax=Microcoleus sp. FACHB-68 TaxID=2692826 RepID=UPI0016869A85|nr:AAA family ATPase [Microcoleus sp. FACHB-68]MBD1938895.1 AAA family ATPase [Microcoleus sp. FACHB-68]
MHRYIKHIKAEGVLGRFDIDQEFQEGVNVLFGKNGTGKTTLLHILANLLNGDYKRFACTEFRTIRVQLNDDTNIVISKKEVEEDSNINVTVNDESVAENISTTRERLKLDQDREEWRILSAYRERKLRELQEDDDEEEVKPILPVAYFPAFRTMIEAWASAELRPRNPKDIQILSTKFARELFGSFVPSLNYPSPIEIERGLSEEIDEALFKVTRADRKYFGELLPNIFQILSKNSISTEYTLAEEGESEEIIEEINSLVKKLEKYALKAAPEITKLRSSVSSFEVDNQKKRIAEQVLNIYRKALREVVSVQDNSFRSIETYLESINSFLEGKSIEISSTEPILRRKSSVEIKFEAGTPNTIPGIRRALSSGERQIVTLIYAATHMSKQEIVLIDEPEISLHVDWQRHLLQKMSEQLGERQIIVCTHSPVIGADYEERVIIFEPTITCSSENTNNNGFVEEDGEVF